MFTSKKYFSLSLVISLLVLTSGVVLAAEGYPNKEIRIIVAAGAGGGLDRMARSVQRFLPEVLGVSVLVENHQGAGGKIGMRYFLKQPADGHTILVSSQPNDAILKRQAPDVFDMSDLSYINVNWVDPTIIVAHKDTGWKTLDDMIRAAKKDPGKYSFAMSGLNSTGPIMGQMLINRLGLNIKMVPYEGGGQARTAIRGRHVDMTAGGAEGMLTIEDVCTPLGVFGAKPLPSWKNVRPVNETLQKYGLKVPNAATIRTFATHAAFKKNHPAQWKTLINAFQKLVNEHEGFKAFCDKSKIGREWYGPEETTALAMETYNVFMDVELKGKK